MLPARIRSLEKFDGPFDAFEVGAGCRVLVARYPAGTEIPEHTHETENCGVITSGELVLALEGRERRYGPGEWYEVPAGAVHAARYDRTTSSIEFCFEVSG